MGELRFRVLVFGPKILGFHFKMSGFLAIFKERHSQFQSIFNFDFLARIGADRSETCRSSRGEQGASNGAFERSQFCIWGGDFEKQSSLRSDCTLTLKGEGGEGELK